MWSIRKNSLSSVRNILFPVTSRQFSEKISLNLHHTIAGRRRFYKNVGVEEVGNSGLYKVTLDGRALKTPGLNPLHLPAPELAIGVALEWDAQTNVKSGIVPASMPLMILASTAIDHILVDPSDARKTCLSFLPTDTALFQTTSGDRVLLAKQRDSHEPILKWLHDMFGVKLDTTDAMVFRIQHSDENIRRMKHIVHNMDHFTLTCLQSACMECKSLVIALALIGRFIDFEQAKIASRIEEEFQIEQWGVVEGGHDMDRLNNSVSCSAVDAFMNAYMPYHQLEKTFETWNDHSRLPDSSHNA